MLLEIPAKSQKNAKIMPDFLKKCHLNSKNALFYFKQNVQRSYQKQVILNETWGQN